MLSWDPADNTVGVKRLILAPKQISNYETNGFSIYGSGPCSVLLYAEKCIAVINNRNDVILKLIHLHLMKWLNPLLHIEKSILCSVNHSLMSFQLVFYLSAQLLSCGSTSQSFVIHHVTPCMLLSVMNERAYKHNTLAVLSIFFCLLKQSTCAFIMPFSLQIRVISLTLIRNNS